MGTTYMRDGIEFSKCFYSKKKNFLTKLKIKKKRLPSSSWVCEAHFDASQYEYVIYARSGSAKYLQCYKGRQIEASVISEILTAGPQYPAK